MTTWAPLIVAQVGDRAPGLLDWIQFGAVGFVVIGFISGWIWPKPSVDRILRDNARLETQVDELTRTYQADVIPTLVRSTEVIARIHRRLGDDT